MSNHIAEGRTDGRTVGRSERWRVAAARFLPTALLLAALASVFIFAGDRGAFYRSPSHDRNSSKNLALAENLSPAHNFRLFLWRSPGEDGEPVYEMYSRFPVGGPALIKLAIAPFGDDLSARIYAARMLMLAMFAGAAVFGYLALARISGSRWIALAATLFAFSSFWLLYHADEISNESVMDIFAAMLVFHGMAVFLEKRRFGQLLAKSCAALLIGWHIYALLLPFIALGFGGEAASALKSAFAERPIWRGLARTAARLALSRYLILGGATLLAGIALLAFNFWNEYTAFDGEIPLRELPSVSSVITRTGGDDSVYSEYEFERLEWRRFAAEQLYRVGVAVLPYSAPFPRDLGQTDYGPLERPALISALGLAAAAGAAACAFFARRRRIALASLALFGFVWSIPMRHSTAFLEYESVVFLGVPMVLATAALMGARRLSFPKIPRFGARLTVAAALAAVVVFAASAFGMSRFERDAERAAFNQALMADFSAMRLAVQGASVFVPTFLRRYSAFEGRELTYAASYALAGSVLAFEDEPHPRDYAADYIISRYRDGESPALETPNNGVLHLYDGARTTVSDLRLIGCPDNEHGMAVACENFAVYLKADVLTYVKDQCEPLDGESRFTFSVFPYYTDDLPPKFRELGHESLNFDFPEDAEISDSPCVFRRELPDYPIDYIEIGQWTPGDAPGWRREVRGVARLRTLACENPQYGTTLACENFAVYIDADTLIYVKDRCGADDAKLRFLFSAFPYDADDLPEYFRELGHEPMNFSLSEIGEDLGPACVFRRELPDYPIEYIEIGQWTPGEDAPSNWWRRVRGVTDLRTLACENPRYGTALFCENFAVYIDGDTLTYAKDRCGAADAESRFLLSVFPHDADDIPAYSRDAGHANMNFDFPPDAMTSGGGCVFRRELPKYPIDYIAIGQWSPSGAHSSEWRREARGVDRLRTLACENARYGAALACENFAVYIDGDTLTYAKDQCDAADADSRFLLSVFPHDADDLVQSSREAGHANMNFDFPQDAMTAGGDCVFRRELPKYPIDYIAIGQWSPSGASPSDWLRIIRGVDRLRTLACENARYGAAAACGEYYDIYLSGGTLTMFAEECSPERARERFFLSVFPEDPANVPQERRERGLSHASMNFDFPRYGVLANGECLITVPLPDYAIAAIETGRADADAGGEWRAKIAVPK